MLFNMGRGGRARCTQIARLPILSMRRFYDYYLTSNSWVSFAVYAFNEIHVSITIRFVKSCLLLSVSLKFFVSLSTRHEFFKTNQWNAHTTLNEVTSTTNRICAANGTSWGDLIRDWFGCCARCNQRNFCAKQVLSLLSSLLCSLSSWKTTIKKVNMKHYFLCSFSFGIDTRENLTPVSETEKSAPRDK